MKQNRLLLLAAFMIALSFAGCGTAESTIPESEDIQSMSQTPVESSRLAENTPSEAPAAVGSSESDTGSVPQDASPAASAQNIMRPTLEITPLADGFSMVRHEGDYGFDAFLNAGGASTDEQVVRFLVQNGLSGAENLTLKASGFGCSTLSVQSPDGGMLFGRNFDWEKCNALVVSAKPQNGYASVSTVNMDFLGSYLGLLPESTRTLAALYAPLDGINEKGLTAAVLMISDAATIDQTTEKPDITTTTAIRLLLDKAATVDEALALLRQYDMHASMGMMVHFALADAQGKSVVVEYVGSEMIVIETPVVTNFYLAEGEKSGIGTAQSHTRYNMLLERLEAAPVMDEAAVRDAMQSVSKQNFGEFESTEWSIVYDQSRGLAHYYHRENYENVYTFSVK